jgi:glycosyltransferase involved in cell wall biosynthesis
MSDRKQRVEDRDLPLVSVVVTVRNEARRLPGLLAALGRQTLDRALFELIVVDDASSDGTPEIAEVDSARVIRAPSHIGLAAGRNLGVHAASAELIAFTDADCIPDETWLERGVEHFRQTYCDILAGRLTMATGERPTIAALVDAATHLDQERYIERNFGAGANLWCRRDVLVKNGGFDERLGMYGEEEEFCQRAVRAGALLQYNREVHVTHLARTKRRQLATKAFLLGYGLAVHRRLNAGTLGSYPRLFADLRYLLPRRRIQGLHRLEAPPTVSQRIRIYTVFHTCVIAPKILGDLVGESRLAGRDLRARRRTRRAGSGTPASQVPR